jgi:hypothetical protein
MSCVQGRNKKRMHTSANGCMEPGNACVHRQRMRACIASQKEIIKCKQDAQATWAIARFIFAVTSSSMTRTLSAGGGKGPEVGGGGQGERSGGRGGGGEGGREKGRGREGVRPTELMSPERSISYVEIPIAKNVADLHGVLILVFILLLFFFGS